MTAAEMKLLAHALRIPKAVFKNERLFLHTPEPDEDPYFFDHVFQPLLERLSGLDRRYVLKDTQGKKLKAIVQEVRSITEAREILERLQVEEKVAA
jgi:transcription-repair coupling factor (superfamily II helicase)